MLREVIGECQHVFVEGRQILDAVMVTNEVVDALVGGKREGLLCKVDIEKVYDHVSWEFADYMLEKMGFGHKWRRRKKG